MATTVTQAVLRTRFKTRVHGMADALTDDEVDDYLEYEYKYRIPHRVPGYLGDGEWSKSTSDGVPDYDLGATIHSIKPPVLLDGDELETFTRIENWYMDHDPTDTTSTKPYAALIYGTKNSSYAKGYHRPSVRLYPIPDSTVYTISGAARLYPTIDLSGEYDGKTLLEDQTFVRAILAGAAMEFLFDQDETERAARESARFEETLSLLRSRSLTPHKERRWVRTF